MNLEDTELMQMGVLVGEIVFSNTGSRPFRFGGPIGISNGKMFFELVDDSGNVSRIEKPRLSCGNTVQYAELSPGDSFRYPVCLFKVDGKYLFDRPGRFSIRVVYKSGPVDQLAPLVPVWEVGPREAHIMGEPGFHGESNWVTIQVREATGRPDLFTASHNCRSVFEAFECPQDAAEIMTQLGSFPGYNREQEKFVAYQIIGAPLIRALLVEQQANSGLLAEAQEALAFAHKHKTGISLWEYIVAELSSFPPKGDRRENWNKRNGYYF